MKYICKNCSKECVVSSYEEIVNNKKLCDICKNSRKWHTDVIRNNSVYKIKCSFCGELRDKKETGCACGKKRSTKVLVET